MSHPNTSEAREGISEPLENATWTRGPETTSQAVGDTTESRGDIFHAYEILGDCVFEQLPAHASPFSLPDPSTVQGAIAFDTETSGLHPDSGARVSVVSLAFRRSSPIPPELLPPTVVENLPADPRYYVSAAFPFGQGPDGDRISRSKSEWNYLVRWLFSAGAGLVGHNAKFDTLQMSGRSIAGWRGRDLVHRLLFDTMVAQFEIDPTGPLALKKISQDLFGEDADAEQQALQPFLGKKSDPRFDLVPWPTMFPYARRDAELTAALFEHQCDLFDQNTLLGGWLGLEMETLRTVARMELAGLPYDVSASFEASRELRARMDEIRAQLPFRPTPVGSRNYFFGSPDDNPPGLGLQPLDRTATGQPSASASVVRRLAADGAPHADLLLEYNRYSSAVSKWYTPFAERAGADSRIRTSLRHTGGTKSGRLSSTRINLQAVPKDYAIDLPVPTPRKLIARAASRFDGWQLWELDLQQAELRVAAMVAGCQTMLDAIVDGRDLHGETASSLFGIDPDHPDWDKYRSLAKRANFSLQFGAGAPTFHQSLIDSGNALPLSEVRTIVYGWRDLYPEFGRAIQQHMAFCDRFSYVETTQGKRRYYSYGEDTHSSFNQVVQSSLAIFAKDWNVHTDRYTRSLGHPHRGLSHRIGRSGFLLSVHDSQILLLHDDEASTVVDHVVSTTTDLWHSHFPGVPGGADAERWA